MNSLPDTLPIPIRKALRVYAARRRNIALAIRVGWAVLLGLIWLILACMLDRLFQLTPFARVLSLCAGMVLPALILFRTIRQLFRRTDWMLVARRIEQANPQLQEKLLTVLWQSRANANDRGSEQLLASLTSQVAEELRQHDPLRRLTARPALWIWLWSILLAGVIASMLFWPAVQVQTLVVRQAVPWADVAPASNTILRMLVSPTRVVEGGEVTVHVDTVGLGNSGVRLMVSTDGQLFVPMAMEPARRGFIQYLKQVERDMDVYIAGGDARTSVQRITVLHKPAVREFRIHYEYPAGMHTEPLTVHNEDGLIQGPAGTVATVTFVTLEPLTSASVRIADQEVPLQKIDDRTWQFQVTLTADQSWQLSMRGQNNLTAAGPGTMPIRVSERMAPAMILGRWEMHLMGLSPTSLNGLSDPTSADAAYQAYLSALEQSDHKR